MPLVAATLRDNIKAALADKSMASETLSTLATTISDYIKANADITFVWTAALAVAPFTSDLVVSATGKIKSLTFTLTPSMATDQPTAINALKTQLIVGLTLGTYNITQTGFVMTPPDGGMATSPSLDLLTLSISGNDPDTALLQLSTNIIDWVKAQVPAGPCAGTRILIYVGNGVVSGIV